MTKVLLYDDQFLTREGLTRMIETEGEMELVGVVKELKNLIGEINSSNPQVVLMGHNAEDDDTAQTLTEVFNRSKTEVLIVTNSEKEAQILAAQAQFEEEKLVAEGKFLNASREQEGLAQGYAAIVDALSENPEGLVSLKALEAQEEVAKAIGQSDNTLIIPTDAAGLFGAVASVKKALEGLSTAGEQSRA